MANAAANTLLLIIFGVAFMIGVTILVKYLTERKSR